MKGFRAKLQHHLNPLHIYCRLRCLGVNGPLAHKLSYLYERFLYPSTLC